MSPKGAVARPGSSPPANGGGSAASALDESAGRTVVRSRGSGSVLPGLSVVCLLAFLAWSLSRLPGVSILGPLVVALILGVLWRSTAPRSWIRLEPGAKLAAGSALKLGIVLLGVRLDFVSLVAMGPIFLLGGVVGAVVVLATLEAVGRVRNIPVELRLAIGMGTAVCGASAIVASVPVLRIGNRHAYVSVATISLVGTVSVLLFTAADALALAPSRLLGVLAGASLQEVGQVVAAGNAIGGGEADLALLVKLSRVAMLAPLLLVLGRVRKPGPRRATVEDTEALPTRATPSPIPLFVVGFLAVASVRTLGLIPSEPAVTVAQVGTWLTAAAMVGIGLGVDWRGLRNWGKDAVLLAVTGFGALVLAMSCYYSLVLP